MANPDLFTVTEAAAVLRIGRTTAYELVRRDFDSGGDEGLGVVRLGGQFRIPRTALERIVGGPLTWPLIEDETVPSSGDVEASAVVVPLRSTGASAKKARTSQHPPTPRAGSPLMAIESPTLPFSS